MRSDAEAAALATEVVKSKWTAGTYCDYATDRYCAVGALRKAAELGMMNRPGYSHYDYLQVGRIIGRLIAVIEEQYPGDYGVLRKCGFTDQSLLERFNDTHTQPEMVALFEKTVAGLQEEGI